MKYITTLIALLLFSFTLDAASFSLIYKNFQGVPATERINFIEDYESEVKAVLVQEPIDEKQKKEMAWLAEHLFASERAEKTTVSPSLFVTIINNTGNYNYLGHYITKTQYENLRDNGWKLPTANIDIDKYATNPDYVKFATARTHEDWDVVFNLAPDDYPVRWFPKDFAAYASTMTIDEEKAFLIDMLDKYQPTNNQEIVNFLFSRAQMLRLKQALNK